MHFNFLVDMFFIKGRGFDCLLRSYYLKYVFFISALLVMFFFLCNLWKESCFLVFIPRMKYFSSSCLLDVAVAPMHQRKVKRFICTCMYLWNCD